jgi:hypothetical protein
VGRICGGNHPAPTMSTSSSARSLGDYLPIHRQRLDHLRPPRPQEQSHRASPWTVAPPAQLVFPLCESMPTFHGWARRDGQHLAGSGSTPPTSASSSTMRAERISSQPPSRCSLCRPSRPQ